MCAVDACGNPVTGTSSIQIVSQGFVQVQMDPQYNDGVEFMELTADGSPCVNQMDDPVLKRFQLTMDFCEVNQTAIAYMMSARELAISTTGYGFAAMQGLMSNHFSLEVWQRVAGTSQCDPVTGLQRWIYNAWPNVGMGKIGQYTIANARTSVQIIGQTRAAGVVSTTGWGAGPGNGTTWLPGSNVVSSLDHWLWTVTTVQPPAAGCNPVTLN
jgi:hypothetical protein